MLGKKKFETVSLSVFDKQKIMIFKHNYKSNENKTLRSSKVYFSVSQNTGKVVKNGNVRNK